jgi:hypothetical protein
MNEMRPKWPESMGLEMAYAQELKMIAAQAEKQEEALSSLAFCFDVYLEHNRRGEREPTLYADGTIAMDSVKSTQQLVNAISNLLYGMEIDR